MDTPKTKCCKQCAFCLKETELDGMPTFWCEFDSVHPVTVYDDDPACDDFISKKEHS